ncbi:MAG: type II toxin-antitoxin system VapC family toxin [Rickettsiales bacterium]|nr:type II toxin-antitoxin system VapC family toxin [Rickettsiales bacterium]
MNLLLDTFVFLAALGEAERLKPEARAAITDPSHQVYISAASFWEIAAKGSIGKLNLQVGLRELAKNSPFTPLDVTMEDTIAMYTLPLVHHDPFDRMILAQASRRNFVLVTADPQMMKYDVSVLFA